MGLHSVVEHPTRELHAERAHAGECKGAENVVDGAVEVGNRVLRLRRPARAVDVGLRGERTCGGERQSGADAGRVAEIGQLHLEGRHVCCETGLRASGASAWLLV